MEKSETKKSRATVPLKQIVLFLKRPEPVQVAFGYISVIGGTVEAGAAVLGVDGPVRLAYEAIYVAGGEVIKQIMLLLRRVDMFS
jgi:hypothetical protein